MNDWKDALSALKGSMKEDSSESNEENVISEKKNEKPQTEALYVVTDRKGRNGKTATIIEGFTVSQEEVEDIARKLKQKLGVGGSVRNGEILIQGDHKEAACEYLKKLNFKVK